jgi:hypothetical protein
MSPSIAPGAQNVTILQLEGSLGMNVAFGTPDALQQLVDAAVDKVDGDIELAWVGLDAPASDGSGELTAVPFIVRVHRIITMALLPTSVAHSYLQGLANQRNGGMQ